MELNLKTLPRMIDISCVKADNTITELEEMVRLAKDYRFICCFSMPCFTPWLTEALRNEKDILVGAPVGFPSGAASTASKLLDVKEQKALGCREFDMVINIGALKSGLYSDVENDIRAVVDAADGYPVKCILEVALLSDDEIRRAAEIAVRSGVTFVKTGTGWAGKPTTVEHIRLLKSVVGEEAYVKAAGGIRTLQDITDCVNAGCSRFGIGIKSIISILDELGDNSISCADVRMLYA